jgi:hypothetical protein
MSEDRIRIAVQALVIAGAAYAAGAVMGGWAARENGVRSVRAELIPAAIRNIQASPVPQLL